MDRDNRVPFYVDKFWLLAPIHLVLTIVILSIIIPHFAVSKTFSISVSTSDIPIPSGNITQQAAVFVKSNISGQDVSLIAIGIPPNVEISFQPQQGVPTFASIMKIQTSAGVMKKNYTITILGIGSDNTSNSSKFNLIIK
jgi:hypothetical protein